MVVKFEFIQLAFLLLDAGLLLSEGTVLVRLQMRDGVLEILLGAIQSVQALDQVGVVVVELLRGAEFAAVGVDRLLFDQDARGELGAHRLAWGPTAVDGIAALVRETALVRSLVGAGTTVLENGQGGICVSILAQRRARTRNRRDVGGRNLTVVVCLRHGASVASSTLVRGKALR